MAIFRLKCIALKLKPLTSKSHVKKVVVMMRRYTGLWHTSDLAASFTVPLLQLTTIATYMFRVYGLRLLKVGTSIATTTIITIMANTYVMCIFVIIPLNPCNPSPVVLKP